MRDCCTLAAACLSGCVPTLPLSPTANEFAANNLHCQTVCAGVASGEGELAVWHDVLRCSCSCCVAAPAANSVGGASVVAYQTARRALPCPAPRDPTPTPLLAPCPPPNRLLQHLHGPLLQHRGARGTSGSGVARHPARAAAARPLLWLGPRGARPPALQPAGPGGGAGRHAWRRAAGCAMAGEGTDCWCWEQLQQQQLAA